MDLAPIEPWPGQHVACKDCLRGEPGLTASAILPSRMFQSSFGDHFGPEKRLCGSNNSGSPVASECITSINCLWHTMAYYGFVQKSSLLFLDEIVCVLFCSQCRPATLTFANSSRLKAFSFNGDQRRKVGCIMASLVYL